MAIILPEISIVLKKLKTHILYFSDFGILHWIQLFHAFYCPTEIYRLLASDLGFMLLKEGNMIYCMSTVLYKLPHQALQTAPCLEIIMTILQMEVRLREVKWLCQGHTAHKKLMQVWIQVGLARKSCRFGDAMAALLGEGRVLLRDIASCLVVSRAMPLFSRS